MTLSSIEETALLKHVPALKLVAFDFDGVFTDNSVYVDQDGRESVRCSRADGLGLRKLEQVGIEPIVISTEVNPVTSRRCEKLKIFCRQGVENKIAVLEELLDQRGFSLSETAFVGNDINDLSCLERVSLPIVVQDAHPDVLSTAIYRTTLPGGYGAVREICDVISGMRNTN